MAAVREFAVVTASTIESDVMMCVEIAEPGGPEVLRVIERSDPVPGPGDVLIQVAAAGVNRPDVMQRRGAYPPPPGAVSYTHLTLPTNREV